MAKTKSKKLKQNILNRICDIRTKLKERKIKKQISTIEKLTCNSHSIILLKQEICKMYCKTRKSKDSIRRIRYLKPTIKNFEKLKKVLIREYSKHLK
jgi:phosphoribulokinase